jgi:hypothetical protein
MLADFGPLDLSCITYGTFEDIVEVDHCICQDKLVSLIRKGSQQDFSLSLDFSLASLIRKGIQQDLSLSLDFFLLLLCILVLLRRRLLPLLLTSLFFGVSVFRICILIQKIIRIAFDFLKKVYVRLNGNGFLGNI